MIVHGRFDDRFPHRPIVSCTLIHHSIKSKISWDFVLDTGADKTFIVPDYQKLLDIPKKHLQFETKPVQTIGGPCKFKFMTGCSLIFNDEKNKPHVVNDLIVYFSAEKGFEEQGPMKNSSRDKAFKGEGKFPNVLGRDVLSRVSLGFCKTTDVLFVTRYHNKYANALKKLFPRPKRKLKYLDEDFEIILDET